MNLSGNTILITGAGTGVGLEAARAFDARGNTVIMVARDEERLRREAAKLKDAHPYACDIADADQVQGLVDHVRTAHPRINALLLNAGVTHTYQLFGAEDAALHAAEEMDVNVVSAVRLTQAFEPLFRDKREAAFIVTTSGVAMAPDVGNPTYSATKAALHSLCQSMRFVLGRSGSPIKVFELMLPLLDTPFSKDVKGEGKMPPAEAVEKVMAGLERDVEEIRVGLSAQLYEIYRQSPSEAVARVNAATGG